MGVSATSAGPLRIAVPLAAALVLTAFAGLLGVAIGSDACAGDSHADRSAEANQVIPPNYLIAYRMAGGEVGQGYEGVTPRS